MRGLVFGAGSIYTEFYYPVFKQLNIKIDIIDPRLNLNNNYSNLFYDFILISSPPQFHYENLPYRFPPDFPVKSITKTTT